MGGFGVFFFLFLVEEGETEVSWKQYLCGDKCGFLFLESMVWFFFLVFFLILEQGAYHLSQYYSIILSWFHFWGALHLFVVSSLPTLKPKLLFLVPCIWKTGNIWYDALLFLSIKICLVLHYSEWSSESVGICVSYFNYLSTWWLLFPSVDWNFRMQVRGLHILSLIIKTGHILFLFSLWKSFRLLILDPFLGMYGLKRPLY